MRHNVEAPHRCVPKDVQENLRLRRDIISYAAEDHDLQQLMVALCKEDQILWYNLFCWTFDPRMTDAPVIPFITYDFQDNAIRKMEESIVDGHDLIIEKSRDMGASWLMVGCATYRWQFIPMQSILFVSRKEEYVDKGGDPKSLFWKVEFLLKWQPEWLKPHLTRAHRKKLHIENPVNGSTMDGESTTGKVARGDRRTLIIMDEFASFEEMGEEALTSTADAANARWFNSTPLGTGNAFYLVVETIRQRHPEWILTLHWSLHPKKAKGLYFDDDGKARSPWYDAECSRRVTEIEIRQELDIDYEGSHYRYFPDDLLKKHKEMYGRPPNHVGDLDYDRDDCEPSGFTRTKDGHLKLWIHPDITDGMPDDRGFGIGIDIGQGSGSSFSVASVVDFLTREKVAELARKDLDPAEFARISIALAKYFAGDTNGAYMCWENNGPGAIFGKTVIDMGYPNVYYKTDELSKPNKRTEKPGFYKNRETGPALMSEYRKALHEGTFINHSTVALDICKQYVHMPDGQVIHSRSHTTTDPRDAKDNHGDHVIADALANKTIKRGKAIRAKQAKVVSANCLQARINEYDRRKRLEHGVDPIWNERPRAISAGGRW